MKNLVHCFEESALLIAHIASKSNPSDRLLAWVDPSGLIQVITFKHGIPSSASNASFFVSFLADVTTPQCEFLAELLYYEFCKSAKLPA
jgi:hypothetical protein